MKLEFFITDVFGSAPYTGNQLATFLGAGDLPTELMQKRRAKSSLRKPPSGGQISVAVGGRVFELAQGWWATCHQDGPA